MFFIGDFCFKRSSEAPDGNVYDYYKKQLNGNIIFIKRNHDNNNSTKTITVSLQIKYDGKYINLVHDPAHANTLFLLNFVGHVHRNWAFKRLTFAISTSDMINVGVDQWNFYPVTYEEIMKKYHKWLKGREESNIIT